MRPRLFLAFGESLLSSTGKQSDRPFTAGLVSRCTKIRRRTELKHIKGSAVLRGLTCSTRSQLSKLEDLRFPKVPIMTLTITVEKDGYYEVNGARQEPNVSLYVIPAASKLRRMLKDTKDLIVCPGVYDGLSARIAMQVGFKGLYMVRNSILIVNSYMFMLTNA